MDANLIDIYCRFTFPIMLFMFKFSVTKCYLKFKNSDFQQLWETCRINDKNAEH